MTRLQIKISITLIFFTVFLLYGCSQAKLLQTNVSEVQKMTITSNNHSLEITAEKDKELIAQIYESINSTKPQTETNPNSSNEQTSEPNYTISIDYSNGSKETIYSTESGKFIYKKLSGNGWIGGNNEQLSNLIKDRFI